MAKKKIKVRNRGNDAIKITACVLAVIIVLAALVGVTLAGSKGGKEWDVNKWFKPEEAVQTVVTDDGLLVSCLEAEGAPISLYASRMAYASDSPQFTNGKQIEIRAVVTPSNVLNKRCVWTMDFVNPESEWAAGKSVTDHISMQVDRSAVSVKISLKDYFSEQIEITATSEDNPEVAASCVIDCLSRITGTYMGSTSVFKLTAGQVNDYDEWNPSFTVDESNFTAGTVRGVFEFVMEYNGEQARVGFVDGTPSIEDYLKNFVGCDGISDGYEYNLSDILQKSTQHEGGNWVGRPESFRKGYFKDLNFDSATNTFTCSLHKRFFEVSFESDEYICDDGSGDTNGIGQYIPGYFAQYGAGSVDFTFYLRYSFMNVTLGTYPWYCKLTFDNSDVVPKADDITITPPSGIIM